MLRAYGGTVTTYDARLRSPEWRRLRLFVLARDAYTCQIHGPRCKGYATEVDHVIARADGGDVWNPANLRASCHPCNMRQSAQRTNAKRRTNDGRRWTAYRTTEAQADTRL